MSSDHYFSAAPGSDDSSRAITVTLAGAERELLTAGGVFSPGHLDEGTDALLRLAPEPPLAGDLLDLGCGWGPIALSLALRAPEATVWAVDVNERALELTRANAARLGLENVRAVTAAEVPAELRFAAIYSNPPIRVGKAVLHELLETWLPRLSPGAEAHLVVAKHLGAPSLERWLGETFAASHRVERGDHRRGFRLLHAAALG